jgi:hypothetical protein
MNFEVEFSKVLSPNDVGDTKSHQAGFLIPIRIAKLSYFPKLDVFLPNPRKTMNFVLDGSDLMLTLNYIYYNGKTLGFSTRNEFRLTGATQFIKKMELKAGDQLCFGWTDQKLYAIKPIKTENESVDLSWDSKMSQEGLFVTQNGWRIKERSKND